MGEIKGCLHLNEDLALTGGAEKIVRQVGIELAQRDIRVGLVSAREFSDSTGLTEFVMPFLRGDYSKETTSEHLQQIVTIMGRYGYNLIHVHNIGNSRLVRAIADEYPVIRTVHDYRSICPSENRIRPDGNVCEEDIGEGCLRCMEQLGISREKGDKRLSRARQDIDTMDVYSLIIVPSGYVREQLVLNGIPREEIEVIPLFLTQTSVTRCDIEQRPDEYNSDVLYVGRLTKAKGIKELLAAFSLIDQGYKMIVVGAVPDYITPKDYPLLNYADDRVRYTGWIDNDQTDRYYQGTKVCVIPSMMPEPFGIVGLEAMRNRKPIVAFNVGGIQEWLHDGENGIFVPRGNTVVLAEKIEFLLRNPQIAERMGETGSRMLSVLFNSNSYMDQLLCYYQEVLK